MSTPEPAPPLRLAVFASGGGTNFQAILDAIADESLRAEVAVCISNRPDAGALDRGRRHDTATAVLDPRSFDAEAAYVDVLTDVLDEHGTTFIALAGYLRKIPAAIVRAYRGRMLNIHPALLPAFGGKGMYGRHVHEAVIDYGVRWTGVTVHLVDEHYDTGPIVLQRPVPVRFDDTPETLAARVLDVEHALYPEALRLFADDRIRLVGRRVQILPPTPEDASTP